MRIDAKREGAAVDRGQLASRHDPHADRGRSKVPYVEMDAQALIAVRQKVLDRGERRCLHDVDHHRRGQDAHAPAAHAGCRMLNPDSEIGRSLQSDCESGKIQLENSTTSQHRYLQTKLLSVLIGFSELPEFSRRSKLAPAEATLGSVRFGGLSAITMAQKVL